MVKQTKVDALINPNTATQVSSHRANSTMLYQEQMKNKECKGL